MLRHDNAAANSTDGPLWCFCTFSRRTQTCEACRQPPHFPTTYAELFSLEHAKWAAILMFAHAHSIGCLCRLFNSTNEARTYEVSLQSSARCRLISECCLLAVACWLSQFSFPTCRTNALAAAHHGGFGGAISSGTDPLWQRHQQFVQFTGAHPSPDDFTYSVRTLRQRQGPERAGE